MKVLTAVLVHDKRINTIQRTMDSLKDVDNVEIFCYDTEKACIEKFKKYKFNLFSRPKVDYEKISHEERGVEMDLPESQILYIAHLRNKVLDKAKDENYDYVFYVDSDILVPKDAIENLLKLKTDIASGWYFNKRMDCINIMIYGGPNMDDVMLSGEIVDLFQAGGGAILMNRNIINEIRFNLYNGVHEEERVFCKKAILKGYKIKADPKIYFPHVSKDYTKLGKEYAEEKIKKWNL